MKIYKDVPEQFHSQFIELSEMLIEENEKKVVNRFKIRRMLPLVAMLVFALSAITVSAACIFMWHQTAKEKLGVSEELAEQMIEEGTTKKETVYVSAEGVNMQAIQSVMTEDYCYVLLSVSVPEHIKINEDTLFRECWIESETEFDGCVINHVMGSDKANNSLWEVQLLTSDTVDYSGVEVNIGIRDLVQTEKTEITQTLIEGEWKIPVVLPLESEVIEIQEERVIQIGHHSVTVARMEVSPFEIRLYGKQEELQHAIQYQQQNVSGINYYNGTFVEENTVINVTKGYIDDKTGEFYIGIELPIAIDIRQYDSFVLRETQDIKQAEVQESEVAQMEILYERCGHRILKDEETLLLWDDICKIGREIVNLTELGYDERRGDSIEVGPGGKWIRITVEEKENVVSVEY